MTMETLTTGTVLTRPGFVFQPLQNLFAAAAAWKARRRRKAELEMLMAMDPHILSDIGVKIVQEPCLGRSLMQCHPASVLATSVTAGVGSR